MIVRLLVGIIGAGVDLRVGNGEFQRGCVPAVNDRPTVVVVKQEIDPAVGGLLHRQGQAEERKGHGTAAASGFQIVIVQLDLRIRRNAGRHRVGEGLQKKVLPAQLRRGQRQRGFLPRLPEQQRPGAACGEGDKIAVAPGAHRQLLRPFI